MQPQPIEPNPPAFEDELLRRFADSMQMNFERWKEGTGYDLEALAAIHGVVDSRYDWSLRPLYLAFNTDDAAARRKAFLALCQTLGVDGDTQLAVSAAFVWPSS